MSNSESTTISLNWLSQQLHRIESFDSKRTATESESSEDRDLPRKLFNLKSSILTTQTTLSHLTAQLALTKLRNMHKRRELLNYELKLLDVRVNAEYKLGNGKQKHELQNELNEGRIRLISELKAFIILESNSVLELLEKDKLIREEEFRLRNPDSSTPHSAEPELNRSTEECLKQKMEEFFNLRYDLKTKQKMHECSIDTVKSETSDALAKIHGLTDKIRSYREHIHQKEQVKHAEELRMFALNKNRLTQKQAELKEEIGHESISHEQKVLELKSEISDLKAKLIDETREGSQAATLKSQLRDKIFEFKRVVKNLEDTASLLKARAREEKIAIRDN
jgi:hypothetical protein